MKCKICTAEFTGDAVAVFCPACLAKLKMPGGGAGSFTKTPPPQAIPAPSPPPAPKRASVREVWVCRGEPHWPLAAAACPGEGVAVLDQPDGYRVLHLDARGNLRAVLFTIPQGSDPGQLDD